MSRNGPASLAAPALSLACWVAMSTNYAVMVYAMGAGTKSAFTAASGGTVIDSGASQGRLIITPDQDCHIRFGSAASGAGAPTAVASDFALWQKQTYVFDIIAARRYFALIRDSADGSAYWAPVE